MKYVGIGVKFHIQFDILLSLRVLLRVPQALPEGVSLPFLAEPLGCGWISASIYSFCSKIQVEA